MWPAGQLRRPEVRVAAVAWLRAAAEPEDRSRMSWVVELWGARMGYNTRRSAFWRVLRSLLADMDGVDSEHWSDSLAWTNLYKASPEGWNPGAPLKRAQRPDAAELLRLEVAAFAPARILALTGGWIGPFAERLELDVRRQDGLVEAVGYAMGRPCVVAAHPMKNRGAGLSRRSVAPSSI
jgi:hypothetical protein